MVNRRNARGQGIVLLRPSANRLRANKKPPEGGFQKKAETP